MGRLKNRLIDSGAEGWIRTEADERAAYEGYAFDLAAAERVRRFFFKHLRHSKGDWAGKPFELLDWQWRDVVAPLFGWKRPDGTRRHRVGYVSVAKKNGKSALCSGLALYMLTADDEPGAEVYSAGFTRKQAAIIFNEAVNMVKASPALSERLVAIPSTKRITYEHTLSYFEALAGEAGGVEGQNAHATFFDELHVQKTRELYDALRYSGAMRTQPLFLCITTAGNDPETICGEQYDYAKAILAGEIKTDFDFFAYIAEADKDDEWTKEATWKKANPSLGTIIQLDNLRADFEEARQSPRKQNSFRRYRLNQWVEQAERWLDMGEWDACCREFDIGSDAATTEWFAGLDLASRLDITAFVLCRRYNDGYAFKSWFWVPENIAKRRESINRERYLQWEREGFLEFTAGSATDYGHIRQRINDIAATHKIRQIAYDSWNAEEMSQNLSEKDGFECVEIRQGYKSLSEPSKLLQSLVVAGQMYMEPHPVMRWMANNVAVKPDINENIRPVKPNSRAKIDGIVAAIMALARASLTAGPAVSKYETEDLLIV